LTELYICKFAIPVTIFRLCVNLSALAIKQVVDSGTSEPIDQARISPRSLQPITIPQLCSFELGTSSNEFALALLHYCTISFNSAGPVTRDGPAEILVSATSQSCCEMPKFWEIFGSLAPQATKKFHYISDMIAK
jgi:hypothetical protein